MSLVNPCGKRDINPFKDNSRAVFWIVIVGKAFGFYMEERVPGLTIHYCWISKTNVVLKVLHKGAVHSKNLCLVIIPHADGVHKMFRGLHRKTVL